MAAGATSIGVPRTKRSDLAHLRRRGAALVAIVNATRFAR
jgi:hypothetical protein